MHYYYWNTDRSLFIKKEREKGGMGGIDYDLIMSVYNFIVSFTDKKCFTYIATIKVISISYSLQSNADE